MSISAKPVFDPRSASFRADPFKIYEEFRAHGSPFQNPDGTWILSSFDSCFRVLSDRKRLGRSPELMLQAFPPGRFHDYNRYTMAFMDEPDHPRVRGSLSGALTPGVLANIEPSVQTACDELLGEIVKSDEFDFVQQFAGPFPLYVICELLGVPRDHRSLFRRAAEAVTFGLEPGASPEVLSAADRACTELSEILEGYIRERRGSDGSDIISLLLSRESASDLSHDELINQLIFLLLAGHETTATLLTFGVKLLLEQPDVAQRLRQAPALIPTAVEEFLRLHPPLHFVSGFTKEAIEIEGVTIPAKSTVMFLIASANRDPRMFPNPSELDIDRRNASRQLAFSTGPHTCLGNNLARLEARLAFREILRRLPNLAFNGTPKRNEKILFQGLETLPLRGARSLELT